MICLRWVKDKNFGMRVVMDGRSERFGRRGLKEKEEVLSKSKEGFEGLEKGDRSPCCG